MTDAKNGPALLPVLNPWAFCTACSGDVEARRGSQNLPCGCVAPLGSVCQTWEPLYGCTCSHPQPFLAAEREAAAALQEALEEQELLLVVPVDVDVTEPVLRVDDPAAVRVVDVRAPADLPPAQLGDDVLSQAARFRAFLGWAAFVAALAVICGLWAAGGPW